MALPGVADQRALVATVRARHPELDTATEAAQFLPFLIDLALSLPPDPVQGQAGLYLKPGGEGITDYNGTNVSISRIAYERGFGVKVLTNAGPSGTNGPTWDDGFVDEPPIHYVEVVDGPISSSGGGGDAQPGDAGDAEMHNLSLQVSDVQKVGNENAAKLADLADQIAKLQAHIDQKVDSGVQAVKQLLEQNGGLGGLINLFRGR